MTKNEFLERQQNLFQQIQDLNLEFVESLPDDEQPEPAEIKVGRLFIQQCAVTKPNEYLALIAKGMQQGWWNKIVFLYIPAIVGNANKWLNAVNPYDRDDAFRATYTTGSLNVQPKGVRIRSGYLDILSTHCNVELIPDYPYIGFGAYIQNSGTTIIAANAGYIPTMDDGYGKSSFRMVTATHDVALPVAHQKPKGSVWGLHNFEKGSADFWHNEQLVFSDVVPTASGQGDVRIVVGPGNHPTNYVDVSMLVQVSKMSEAMFVQMQNEFKLFATAANYSL